MCLIAFAWGASERFPFVIAANRDEFLERPTAPLSLWQSPSGASILAGRDLKDGGTWMGFSPSGRFAMLTNVREPLATPPTQPSQPISRGGLAMGWLTSDLSAAQWAKSIEPHRYQGFNLIVGDWTSKQCFHFSHQQNLKLFKPLAGVSTAQSATQLIATEMPWGAVYGLSNAALDTPWPKTQLLKNALQRSLESADAQQLTARNLRALADESKPLAADLPATGVPQALELALSSAFVSHPPTLPSYGTRSSLVAVFEATIGLQVTEVTHPHDCTLSTQIGRSMSWR